jgi:DNA-binding response OmpR family regulator
MVIKVLSWVSKNRKTRTPVKKDLPPDEPPELPPEPIRVLHVDDEPDHLIISKRLLEKFDSAIQVVSESSPEEALQKAETFDVVVSDYKMPGMNGIELAKRIKEKTDNPIIIYTGKGSEEVASSAFEAGIDDYLKKEFGQSHYKELVKRIRMVVERHKAELRAQNGEIEKR